MPDGAQPTDLVTFNIVKDDYSGFATMTLTWAIASALNLPDYFPPYKQLFGTFGQVSFPVVSKAEAEEVCKEVGGDPATLQDSMASLVAVVYPSADARLWTFNLSGGPIQAAGLVAQKNANGVGAPGHWNGLTWVPENKVETSPNMPVPIGPVAPGSTLVMINTVYMLQEPDAPAPVVTGGGGTDPNSAAILAGVNKLLAFFRLV